MKTTAYTHRADFVAKATFPPQQGWFGKYERFWFDSHKHSYPGASDKQQFVDLKKFLEANVLHKCTQLAIFDNRETSVHNPENPVNNRAKIIYEWSNGYVVQDVTLHLSFLDANVSADFLKKMLQSFSEPTQADIENLKLYGVPPERPEYLNNDMYIEAKPSGFAIYSPEMLSKKYNVQI